MIKLTLNEFKESLEVIYALGWQEIEKDYLICLLKNKYDTNTEQINKYLNYMANKKYIRIKNKDVLLDFPAKQINGRYKPWKPKKR